MPAKSWSVDPTRKALVLPGGETMKAACHHHRGRPALTACGGCYARALEALSDIEQAPRSARRVTRDVFAAIRSDAEPRPSIPSEKQLRATTKKEG